MIVTAKEKRVHVWDPNPFNPYGTELARVIGGIPNVTATHYTRRNRPYGTDEARTVESLPAPAAGNHSHIHAITYMLAVFHFIAVCVIKRPIIVFPWIMNRWEILMTRFLQLCRLPTVIVVHNPIKERDELEQVKGLRAVRESATALVVHTDRLRAGSSKLALVAAHPSYKAWNLSLSHRQSAGRPFRHLDLQPGLTAVFVGSIREDKGFFELPSLADFLDSKGIRLLVCVGIYSPRDVATLRTKTNVSIVGDGRSYLDDEVLHSALKKSNVMVAPYRNVTVSGSVLLAMTMGLPVVAFDCPEFSRILGKQALAPEGDMSMLADLALMAAQEKTHKYNWAENQDCISRHNWASILANM
ncbi:hypothetical protein CIK52_17065 [Kocuria rosea]|nr:hypothetical protein CIK52_17065 [Kocuria rosea]QCY33602.1 glycosyltransferase [Kocuria rosea]TQN35814.1 glycosyltransferase involved in cell wall biosynthesis [Kocuria rosea]